VLGPKDFVTRILPFDLSGRLVFGVVYKLNLPHIMLSHSFNKRGQLLVKFFNSGHVSKFITHKIGSLDIMCDEPELRCDFSESFTRCVENNLYLNKITKQCLGVADWKREFSVLEDSNLPFASAPDSKDLMVCHKELLWKIPFDEMPLLSRGTQYNPGVSPFLRQLST